MYMFAVASEDGNVSDGGFATCESRCDESYFPNKPCYCNEACTQYENCCYDYIALCARA